MRKFKQLKGVNVMTDEPLAQFANYFRSRETGCYKIWHQLRWPDGVRCPRCHEPALLPEERCRVRCRNCRKFFTAFSKTLLQGSKLRLSHWFTIIWAQAQDQPISGNRIARCFTVPHPSFCRAAGIVRKIRREFPRDTSRWGGDPFEMLLREMAVREKELVQI